MRIGTTPVHLADCGLNSNRESNWMTPLYLRVEASSQKQLFLQPRWATGRYGYAPAFIGEDGTDRQGSP